MWSKVSAFIRQSIFRLLTVNSSAVKVSKFRAHQMSFECNWKRLIRKSQGICFNQKRDARETRSVTNGRQLSREQRRSLETTKTYGSDVFAPLALTGVFGAMILKGRNYFMDKVLAVYGTRKEEATNNNKIYQFWPASAQPSAN